eukprot:Nk52_evm1s248 gene=Nk52_evmTU1s248
MSVVSGVGRSMLGSGRGRLGMLSVAGTQLRCGPALGVTLMAASCRRGIRGTDYGFGGILFKRDYQSKHPLMPKPKEERGLMETVKIQAKKYWEATKQLWRNVKIAREIKADVAKGKAVSYQNHCFISTHSSDTKKLLPFLVLYIVLPEVIPLIVVGYPSALPSTFTDEKEKAEMRRNENFKKILASQEAYLKLVSSKGVSSEIVNKEIHGLMALAGPKQKYEYVQKHFGELFDIKNMPEEALSLFFSANGLAPPKIAPLFWVKRRVNNALSELEGDDKDLFRTLGTGTAALTGSEMESKLRERFSNEDVYLALSKRGCVLPQLDDMNKEEVDLMYQTLTLWMKTVRLDANARIPLTILNCITTSFTHPCVSNNIKSLIKG